MKAFALLNHRSRRTLLPFTLLLAALLVLFTPQAVHAQYPSHQKISDTAGDFIGTIDDFDLLGVSVTALGDLDGDGTQDLALGAAGDDDGSTDRGAVWILFLNTDGTVKSHQKISDTQGGFTGTLDDGDYFGASVTALGDLNGDGTTEIAVGAPFDDDGGASRGAIWILFLNSNGTVKSHQKISDTQGSFTGILDDNDNWGQSVTSLGDLDGDGTPDLAIGARDNDGGAGRGAVWILFLNTDGTVKSHQKISDTQGGFTGVLDNLDFFGVSVTSLGDLGGEGTQGLAVGAPFDDDGGSGRGAVWILFLNNNGTVKSHQKISDTQGGFTGILDDFDNWGQSVTLLDDLDGDGTSDLAVGAISDDDGGSGKGAVWILFLNPDGTVKLHEKISDTQGGFTGTLDDGNNWGQSVTSLGDLDGDGTPDLAVGTYLDDDGGTSRGAVWILFRQNPQIAPVLATTSPLVAGDTLSLHLDVGTQAYPVQNLFGAGARLHYDPALLHIDSVKTGPFLDDGNLLLFTDIDNVNGETAVTVSRTRGASGVTGFGTVAILYGSTRSSDAGEVSPQDALLIINPLGRLPAHVKPLTLTVFSALVWPGDTDANGRVDVADLMPVGTYFDTKGPARIDQGFDWSAKGVVGTWAPSQAVFADALGDGTVTQNDALAVAFNLGLTDRNEPARQQATVGIAATKTGTLAIADVPYRLRVYHNRRKQQARARLVLGSGTNPATDLLGTAVTLTYDPAVYSFRSHQPGTLIDDGDLLSLDDQQDGSIAIAYTRKAPNGSVSGRGPVLDVLFDVIGEPHEEAMMLQRLTLGTTQGSIAVVGPDAIAARAELGLDTAPAEPVVAKAEEETPVSFALTGAYPNPFNPATTIAFDLPDRAEVRLIVVDLLGREVRRLDVGSVEAGAGQTVRFEGAGLPSGVYLYRIEARTSEALHTATGRFTLLK